MNKSGGAIGFAVYPEIVANYSEREDVYDVDTVIIYDDNADIKALFGTLKLLTDSGKTVIAVKEVPEKLKYKQLLRFKERGVEIIEDNA